MKKRQQPKKNTDIKIQEAMPQEEQDDHTPGKRGRLDNSLSVLTKKFIELVKNSQNCTIDLNVAVNLLGVQKRRIYDITNVLEGINYVEKTQKNMIRWIGGRQDPEQEREVLQMKRRLEELANQQTKLDNEIHSLRNQLTHDYLQNDQYRDFCYLTHQDLLTICKNMHNGDASKGMLVLGAPRGAQLEIKEEEGGECELKMDASGMGDIKAYFCTPGVGIREVNSCKKKN